MFGISQLCGFGAGGDGLNGRLLGLENSADLGDSGASENTLCANQYTAVDSGALITLKLWLSADAVGLKVAIYADSGSNTLGTRLWVNNTGQAGVSGVNTWAVTGVTITKGTKYWLVFNGINGGSYITQRLAASGGLFGYTLTTDYASVGCPTTPGAFSGTTSYAVAMAGYKI
jgi:hypothetical protein